MTQPAALCPNCGAPVRFCWSSSVQTTCDQCHSILVRTDVDLKLVGVVADLPPDSSPIQLGTEGTYKSRRFTAAGRIIYSYDEGSWNEWHIVMQDGTSAWLADAQSQYVLTFAMAGLQLPPAASVRVGDQHIWNNVPLVVTTITKARYRGVQGELPFEYWDKREALFLDLLSTRGDFATLDYSDEQPVLYMGEVVNFDSLQLQNMRELEGWQ
jgi:hypothetical protein